MIYKILPKKIALFLAAFALVFNGFSLHAQKQLEEKFKKTVDYYGMEYKIPKDYYGIKQECCYDPQAGFLQSGLTHSIKCKKQAVAVAFALISTKPDNTPRGVRIREVFGDQNKINKETLANQADTTLSKVKYLDAVQLKKVNADFGAIYNIKINNKYMGIYGRCKKIELYKDDVGRAEILFFYNKGDDALVDEEIKKTWGMLKFKP
jgi:hypothetical protein